MNILLPGVDDLERRLLDLNHRLDYLEQRIKALKSEVAGSHRSASAVVARSVAVARLLPVSRRAYDAFHKL